jgi:Fe-S-cluster containining protein
VRRGARIDASEYVVLEEEFYRQALDTLTIEQIKGELSLPVVGQCPPRKCVFLEGKATCLIYEKRPRSCKEYPIIVTKVRETVTFHVSVDCPRGERIAQALASDLPAWASEVVGKGQYKVISSSFFDLAMSSFLGEEL